MLLRSFVNCDRRLGVLFFMVLYLSMMALGSLPLWRQESLLFQRCAPSNQSPPCAMGSSSIPLNM